MWLSLILLGLVLGITIRQATLGLFCALFMTVLSICCATLALGTYEFVAAQWIAPYFKPEYALPIALGATFAVPLGLVRVIFDKLIRRASLLPALVDKVGAGACGLLTGMIITGLLALALEMIPFQDGAALGYSRVQVVRAAAALLGEKPPDEALGVESNLWLKQDQFTARFASMLSDGVFSGSESLSSVYPHLAQSIGWTGATDAEVSRFAQPGSITVVQGHKVDAVYRMTPGEEKHLRGGVVEQIPPIYEKIEPRAGYEFAVARLRLGKGARDQRKGHAFTLRQFRLVGQVGDRQTMEQYHAIAIQQRDTEDPVNRHIRFVKRNRGYWPVVDEIYSPRDKGNEVEVAFEVPLGFQSTFIEYKRLARAAIKLEDVVNVQTEAASAQPNNTTVADAVPTAQPPSSKRKPGRARGTAAKGNASFFGNAMPMTLTSYQQRNNVELSRAGMKSGHLIAFIDRQSGGSDRPVSTFHVPDDKRLLQLASVRLNPRSTLGRALSQAVQVVQNYFVEDDRGRRYKLVGKYAISNVGGRDVMEVQYFSEPVGSIGGVGAFARIKENKLKPQDPFVLLFLVEPGARIVAFSTGGSATQRDDLRIDNLVAPQ